MKVLMINSVCGIRSTGRICTDIADILETSGHECKIAYGRESFVPDRYQKYAVRIGMDLDVKFHALESRIFDNAGFGSKRATEKFIEWVKDYDPDVIHLHNIHGYYLNIKVLFNYLKLCGKKIIWTLHDCWSFTGHCVYFDFVHCEKWKFGCSHCPQLREYPSSVFFDRSEQNYAQKMHLFCCIPNMTIVTPSRWLAELVKKSYLRDYSVEVIPNGIDISVFKPTESNFKEKYGLQNKSIILGVASVWDRRKGLDDFIQLSSMLNESYKIVLVGLNKKQLKILPQNIIGITRTNSTKELAEIYTAADVLLNLTYEDNYPTTNLEARACGTPVITYETGGSPESLTEKTGIVVRKGDIDELCKAITSDNEYSHINGINFDKSEKYGEYLKLYLGSRNETSIHDKRTVSIQS